MGRGAPVFMRIQEKRAADGLYAYDDLRVFIVDAENAYDGLSATYGETGEDLALAA